MRPRKKEKKIEKRHKKQKKRKRKSSRLRRYINNLETEKGKEEREREGRGLKEGEI